MMNKKSSSELHPLKYLVLVPFFAAAVLAFNVSKAGLKVPAPEVVKAEIGFVPADTSGSPENYGIPALDSFGKTQEKKPLLMVDGSPVNDIDELEPSEIASVTVLKDAKATSLFGKRAEAGVILIVTKDNAVKAGSTADRDRAAAIQKLPLDKDILYFIDGEEASADEVEELNPQVIQKINVLKDKSATDKYGEKGKNGVIEIIIKN